MFGLSLVNGSLGKGGKDQAVDEHFGSFLDFEITVCFMPTKSCLSSPIQTKMASQMGCPLRTILQEVLFSIKLRVYLRKFTQIGRTQRRCLLPFQLLASTTHVLLSLQPDQLEELFLLNDDVVVPIGFRPCLTTSQAGVSCASCVGLTRHVCSKLLLR